MGTIKDKQTYNVKTYVQKLIERREALEERKEYILEMSLKNAERKAAASAGPTGTEGATGGEDTTSQGSVVLNGEMPTIAQYTGPDVYSDEYIGGNVYQTGLKAKLAGTDKWNKDIMEQAAKAGVNPLIVKVVMATESAGTHKSTPNAYRCVGLMQVQDTLVISMGLDWAKAKSDPIYNIFCGCKALINKQDYAKNVINNAGEKYRYFKSRGAELKANCHGTAWMYNGFSMPENGSSKVTTGGVVYANQVAAMYAGFGRDARVDTVKTTDVLGNSSGGGSATASAPAGSTGGVQEQSFRMASESVAVTVIEKDLEREMLSTEEALFIERRMEAYGVPIGKMNGRYYKAPKYSRRRYVEDRKLSGKFRGKENYAPLNAFDFLHLGGPQENYYAKEAREVFRNLKERLGNGQMVISRGFDPQLDSNNSSHSAGIAIDIHARTPEEALKIADTAWMMGIRAIAIGPKFVHIDTGPEAVWGYDKIPVYRGPGTVKREAMNYGYK